MPAGGEQLLEVPLTATGIVVSEGTPVQVSVSGAVTRQPTPGLLFFCSTVEWNWACESAWADLVSDQPIPPAGLRGVYGRAFASWAGAEPGNMDGSSDLSLLGPAHGELYAGRGGWECYYELNVRNRDGTMKYPYEFGPCHTFGGGYVVTIQPNDGAGTLVLSASRSSLPATGGSVTFLLSTRDGSTPADVSWEFVEDVAAPPQIAIPPTAAAVGGNPLDVAAARGEVFTIDRAGRLVRGKPLQGGILLVRRFARSAPSAPVSAVSIAPGRSQRPSAASPAADACVGQVSCTLSITATGAMVARATVNGAQLSASARVAVGAGGGGNAPVVVVDHAAGPHADGSFVAQAGSNVVTLTARVTPDSLTPQIVWEIVDDPTDAVASVVPSEAPRGATTSFVVTAPDPDRWRGIGHPGTLSQKSLSYQVRATVTADAVTARSDAVTVRQNEFDTLQQEYEDYGVDQPSDGAARSNASVGSVSWSQLNQGDYRIAFVEARLLDALSQLQAATPFTITLSSGYRNPVHQRFHITPSGGGLIAPYSIHQSGLAVDVNTGSILVVWNQLHRLAWSLGACVEPIEKSTVDHVHADWRPLSQCAPSWRPPAS